MNKLIIAEKPSVALRIAQALGNSPKRNFVNGVSYYEFDRDSDHIFIVAAAGHLFSLTQKGAGRDLPIFEIGWEPAYKVRKEAYFTKKYLDLAEITGKKCAEFINACDYDLEGTVIGTNIVKYILKKNPDEIANEHKIKRMHFSTTTNEDLEKAYKGLIDFDYANFNAGETRHMLDWMWGINMSRALMRSVMSIGIKKILSIGRVQGPALAILAKRENEIKTFVSKPFWKVNMVVSGTRFENRRGEIFEKEAATRVFESTKKAEVFVKEIEAKEERIRPNPPFDLTTLQLEASRTLRIDPTRTLAIAQALYERSYISYPRTSSQKLPYTLNLPKIIRDITKNEKYAELANRLVAGSRYKPAEGYKEDEAHPAIFPTGIKPAALNGEEDRIYDLIMKRFLACFAEWALLEKRYILLMAPFAESASLGNGKTELDASGDFYDARGVFIKEKGWIDFYRPYANIEQIGLPDLKKGEKVKPEKVEIKEGKTQPPKRYTKASLIALLEKRNLGTKATRAQVIDTLFKRGYVKGSIIETTEFGMSIFTALDKYCGIILDEEMTRKLEEDMDRIAHGSMKKEDVVQEGKDIIVRIIGEFGKNEKNIGNSLKEGIALAEKAEILGACNKDGGNMVVKRSRLGKQFAACANWPQCNNTYPLPTYAKILPTGKTCEICKTPIVKVIRKGKRVFEMDLDPNCSTKAQWKTASQSANGAKAQEAKKEEEINAVKASDIPKKEREAKAGRRKARQPGKKGGSPSRKK